METKKWRKKNKKKKTRCFLVLFFTFARKRSKIRPWRNLYFFNVWGTCSKKNIIFHTFFSIFFIPHLILRNKKCMTNWKKVRFLAFCLTLFNKKSFFQHLFFIFLTKNFQFSISSHIIKHSILIFFHAHPTANI